MERPAAQGPAPIGPTVAQIEQANASAHQEAKDARDAVQKAVEAIQEYKPEPIEALGATPVNLDLGHEGANLDTTAPTDAPVNNDEQPPVGPPPPVPPPVMPPGM